MVGLFNHSKDLDHGHVVKHCQPSLSASHNFGNMRGHSAHDHITDDVELALHLGNLVELVLGAIAQLRGDEDALAHKDFGIEYGA